MKIPFPEETDTEKNKYIIRTALKNRPQIGNILLIVTHYEPITITETTAKLRQHFRQSWDRATIWKRMQELVTYGLIELKTCDEQTNNPHENIIIRKTKELMSRVPTHLQKHMTVTKFASPTDKGKEHASWLVGQLGWGTKHD